jgi:hypothetical protein
MQITRNVTDEEHGERVRLPVVGARPAIPR